MSYWQSLLLGVLQGVTEFLPVSSSGHLAMGRVALGLEMPGITYEVVVHAGTLLAVVVAFWRDLVAMVGSLVSGLSATRGTFWSDPHRRLAGLIVLGSVPTALLALALEDMATGFFVQPAAVGAFWIITGLVLLSTIPAARRERAGLMVSPRSALVVGLAQGLAVMPGISRSGMTITAGLWMGLPRDVAARFSFLLAVPVIFGATVIDLLRGIRDGALHGLGGVYAVGFVAAAVSGYLAIGLLLRLVAGRKLHHFAYYCLAAGALTLVLWTS